MNKVYRVIWSHVTNTFIAVSELATSKGKVKSFSAISSNPQPELNSSIPATFKLSAIALLSILTLSPAQVFAEDVIADNLTVNQTSNFKGAATFDTATFKSIATTTLTVGGKTVATDEKVTTLTETVNQKANQTDVNELKTDKADKSVVDGLSTEVNTLKTNKADKSVVDGLSTEVNTLKTNKADKSVVDGLTTEVNTLKNTKADKSELTKLSNLVTSLGVPEGTTTYTGIKYFRAKSELEDAAAEGKDSLAIGPKAKTGKTATDSVALGHDSTANATESIAIGKKAYAVKTANKGIAIGEHARVGSKQDGDVVYDGASSYVLGPKDGESSVAIGDNAVSRGEASIAIGKNAITSNKDVKKIISKNNIALGTSAQAIASDNSIALGNTSRVNKDSDSSVAIGDAAETFAESAVALGKTAQAKGVASVALGLNAKSHTASTVAIGKDSEALSSQSIAIGELAKAMPNKTISIGLNAGKGQESDKEGTKHSHINIGENAGENVIGQYNIGIGTEAGKGVVGKANIALGIYAGTNLANSKETVGDNVSIGNASNNYKTATPIQRGTAVGAQSLSASDATALGYDTKATGLKSTAVGFSADAEGEQAVAIGANAKSDANNVALGANSLAKASNKSGYLTGKNSSLVVSVGSQEGNANQHILRRLTNVADGADEQDAVTVAQLKRVSEDVTTKLQAQFNNLAHSSATSDVKYDLVSPDPNSGANHKITLKENTRLSNVAPAINGTDAVNLNQLRDTINTEKTHYFSVNDKDLTDRPSNYDNDGAVGKLSMAIGQSVIARKERSVAIGNQASAHGVGSIAIGTLYVGSPELDDGKAQSSATNAAISNQPYQYGLAIGAGANSEGNNSLAIGSLAATSNKDIQNGNVDRAIAIGYRAVSSAEKANAIGDRAVANSLTGNAFGSEAFSGAVSSNAIGTKANATGENSIAFGTHQNVTGANSGSIGYAGALGNKETTVISGGGTYSLGNTNSTLTANESGIFGNSNEIKAKENARIVGNKNTIGAIEEKAHVPGTPPAAPANDLKDIYVTGYDNKISSDKKLAKDLSGLFVYGHNNKVAQLPDPDSTEEFTLTDSSVIGANNTLNTKGKNYFVLGNNVTATLENSVYLGADSAYTTGNSTSSMNAYADMANGLNKSGYTFAGSQPVGVVTVGAVGKERRVQNVAAGLVTEASTDAINGSQLFALTRPLRFAGDNSTLTNPDQGKPTGDATVISRGSNQGMKILGGESDTSKLTGKTDKNIGVISDGNNTLEVRLAKTLSNLTEATFGTGNDKTTINKDGVTIVNNGKPNVSLTDSGLNNGGNKITNVAPGVEGTDAVNMNQLNALKADGFALTGEDNETIRKPLGESIKVTGDNNVNTKILKEGNNPTGLEISLANNVKLGKAPEGTTAGEAGKVTLTDNTGKDRAVLDGTDGSLTLTGNAPQTGSVTAPSAKIKVAEGAPDLENSPATANDPKKKTRITYEIPGAGTNPTVEELATLNDGLKFGANDGTVHNAKLNTQVDVKGKATNTIWGNFDEGQNIMTQINGNTITVALAKALSGLTSATFGDPAGNPKDSAVINKDGLTITDGDKTVKLTDKVLDNGGNQIENVASGLTKDDGTATTSLKDAVQTNGVNVGDLKTAIDNITAGNNPNGDNNPLGGFGLKDKQGNTFKQNLGETAAVIGDANVNTKVVDFTDPITNKAGKALEVSLANQLTLGKAADPTVQGSTGEAGKVTLTDDKGKERAKLDGTDGSLTLTGNAPGTAPADAPSAKIKVATGKADLVGTPNDDPNNAPNNKTRITYEIPGAQPTDPATIEELATLNDGLKFGANDGAVHNAKLNSRVDVKGHANNTTWADFDAGQNIMTQIQGNTITVALAKALKDLTSASFVGGTNNTSSVLNGNGLTITKKADAQDPNAKDTVVSLTEKGLDNGGNQIVNVASGLKNKDGDAVALKDATGDVLNNGVNVGDLKDAITNITSATNGGFGLKDKEGNEFKQDLGTAAQITGDDNINTKVVDGKNGGKALEVSLADNITLGKPTEGGVEGVDGSVKVTGKDGASVVLNGKDGTIGLTGPRGADGKSVSTDIGVKEGAAGVDGTDGANGTSKTRIVYTLKDKDGNPIKDANDQPITEEVATLNDGMKFEGNDGTVVTRKLNETLGIKGGIDATTVKDNSKVSSGNLGVRAVKDDQGNPTGSLEVVMKERPEFSGIVLNGKDGQDASIKFTDKDGNESLSMTTTKDKDGNATLSLVNPTADKFVKITGVAEGDISPTSKDAVNGSQLHAVKETAELAASGWNISVNENANNNVSNVKPKHTVDLNNTDGNIVISKTVDNDKHNVTFDLANKVVIGPKDGTNQPQEGAVVISGKEGADGKGSISIAGKDGKDAVAISGKDGVGTIGLTGPAGADGKNANAIIGVKDSVKGLDGNDGKDGNSKTRIVYTKPDGTEEQVATMNDGLVFGADKGTEHKAKLGTTVKVKGDDKNIETEVAGDTIRVRLKDNIDVKGINVTENLTVKEGAKINMGNNVIDGVADGEVSATSKQAVNGSQLHKVQQQVNNQATAINKLGDHINKVDKDLRAGIAGATAVAFLQRPNEAGKSIVSLGVGSYRSESAIAVGYARNSDNNKISIKLGGGMNSRGDVNFGGSIGYQW
ncbi:YadA-like family protein [Pasteurella multocida]|uniref:YadA-like family protein n=1 Tax=Pasteurella multocida TaxID=747 RepID=UPI002A502CFA|nr:YadA-like family protein [Pasteurella multocida]MDY0573053.1 YadA-like family protein [Pasteurella multocida]MDY0579450.1 YadA-like family protein [Pasteurella multocida]MDY0581542.1 YadA-like family protein [Pasteurella multocida]MDY0596225.1 YadA-like family protein [Pasteurella multocida]